MKWERAKVKEQTLDPLWLSPLYSWARRGFKADERKDTGSSKCKPFPCERCLVNDSKYHGPGFCISVCFQTKVQDPAKCLGHSFSRLLRLCSLRSYLGDQISGSLIKDLEIYPFWDGLQPMWLHPCQQYHWDLIFLCPNQSCNQEYIEKQREQDKSLVNVFLFQ